MKGHLIKNTTTEHKLNPQITMFCGLSCYQEDLDNNKIKLAYPENADVCPDCLGWFNAAVGNDITPFLYQSKSLRKMIETRIDAAKKLIDWNLGRIAEAFYNDEYKIKLCREVAEQAKRIETLEEILAYTKN